MSIIKTVMFGAMLLLGLAAWAQEFPRIEVGADYSYVRFNPSTAYSKGHSANGGGGSAVFNLTSYLGIKMDLQGFGSNTTGFNIAPNPTFPNGAGWQSSGQSVYLFVWSTNQGPGARSTSVWTTAVWWGALERLRQCLSSTVSTNSRWVRRHIRSTGLECVRDGVWRRA